FRINKRINARTSVLRTLQNVDSKPIHRGIQVLDAAVDRFNKAVTRMRIEVQDARKSIAQAARYFSTTNQRRSELIAMSAAQDSRAPFRELDRELVGLTQAIDDYRKTLKLHRAGDVGAEQQQKNQREKFELLILDHCQNAAQRIEALTSNTATASHQIIIALAALHDITLDLQRSVDFLQEHGFPAEKITLLREHIAAQWKERTDQLHKVASEADYLIYHPANLAA
ncbi:MAG TPA: hypothetical protein VJK52_00545, partial [Candidatus Nanoarchaeia archaeon]|nr:hypothetical protein [Candidatus Nanoarchaeia archaeon]